MRVLMPSRMQCACRRCTLESVHIAVHDNYVYMCHLGNFIINEDQNSGGLMQINCITCTTLALDVLSRDKTNSCIINVTFPIVYAEIISMYSIKTFLIRAITSVCKMLTYVI